MQIKCGRFILICSIFCPSFSIRGHLESLEVSPLESTESLSAGPKILTAPKNVTLVKGESATLPCRARGHSDVKIVWYSRKTGRVQSNHGVRVRHHGLEWEAIKKSDEDWYRCGAKSSHGESYSQWAYVKVLAKTKITDYPGGYSVNFGTQLLLRCVAEGDPSPEIKWYSNGNLVINGIEFTSFTNYVRSVLTVNATETANYTCVAQNTVKGGTTYDKKTFTLAVVHPITPIERPRGFCAPYEGRICRKHLGGRGLVWYNISETNRGGWANEQITSEIWAEMISNFKEPCRTASEQLLCRFAFPACHMEVGYQIGLPLCQEDCFAVQHLFCVNEWLMIQDSKKKPVVKSRDYFRLPQCDGLPRQQNEVKKVCSSIGLTKLQEDQVTYDCVNGSGRWYMGTVNVTKDGIHCQPWDEHKPHAHHNRPPNVFPEVQNSENYCRNAGGEEPRPWCYTQNKTVRWQYCDIPVCEVYDLPSSDKTDGSQIILTPETLLILAGGAAMVSGLLMLCLLVILSHKLIKTRQRYQAPVEEDANLDLSKLPSNSAYHQTSVRLNPKLEKLQYDRNNIVFIRDLGQGAFGRVFQGKAAGIISGEESTLVAVKVLKEEASQDMVLDFEREACTLSEFNHPNIVKLLAVCAVGHPMCLLFEFMGKGDLNEYLRSCSPSNYIVRSGEGNTFTDTKIPHQDMLWISVQIAAGMVYLADRKFVHRDLATRNCLIGEDMTVKIADFGLSQKIYASEYYRGDDRDAIPIRWMPLESILYNKYTVESDVWAFGVCLWEIFSYALQPYYGMTHEEVVEFLKEGRVLACPENCPPDVYSLMTWCWQTRSHHRPPFQVLHQNLNDLLSGRTLSLPMPSIPPGSSMGRQSCCSISGSTDTYLTRPCSCAPPDLIAANPITNISQ